MEGHRVYGQKIVLFHGTFGTPHPYTSSEEVYDALSEMSFPCEGRWLHHRRKNLLLQKLRAEGLLPLPR